MIQPLPPINEQRVLAVYAHPDDECYCSGGTLAYYNQSGAETMVVSATKGDAGEINDTYRATRRTLGAVRAKELHASCEKLGVNHVKIWDYPDGSLATVHEEQLISDILAIIQDFRPHIIITFGPDGGYGHPDHIAISYATRHAVLDAESSDIDVLPRLYFAHFPQRPMLLLEELSRWLMAQDERFKGSLDFLHALSIFAGESTMLHYSSDFVDTRWYPPGFCIVEQGEVGNQLFVVLSGQVEVKQEDNDGQLLWLADLSIGEFFGEIGVATHHTRNAHVIAKTPTTCLIFSPGEPTNFAGRGAGATLGGATHLGQAIQDTGQATHVLDVQDYIVQKVEAIGCHRTQFPITATMFPLDMLKRLFGREYFVRIYPKVELETSL